MNRRGSLAVIHLVGCLTFLALPYIFAQNGLSKLAELPYNPHEQRTFLSYLFTITVFYANYYIFIPKFYFQRRYVLYVVSIAGCFLLIERTLVWVNRRGDFRPAASQTPPPPPDPVGKLFPRPAMPPPPLPPNRLQKPGSDQPGLPSEIYQTFVLFMLGFLLSLALRINNRWRETEREKLNTELSYLKAQINPHFLFNTLNSIYSLAIEKSDLTADAIIRLSSLMRYVIQDATINLVPLAKELDYISHYVALQQLRLAETVQIDFAITGQISGQKIAPLILISFIENAFKYGVNPNEDSRIQISLTIQNGELHCYVFNKKVRISQETIATNGIGLANTKARLQLVYPDRHRLLINDQPDEFTVDLFLTLT